MPSCTARSWPKTLFIWTYDEHGGYYDHVAPPPAVEPDGVPRREPDEALSVARIPLAFLRPARSRSMSSIPNRTTSMTDWGFRVPAVIVSPYAKPEYVAETVYDHTSILKLIERNGTSRRHTARYVGGGRPPLMRWISTSPPTFPYASRSSDTGNQPEPLAIDLRGRRWRDGLEAARVLQSGCKIDATGEGHADK